MFHKESIRTYLCLPWFHSCMTSNHECAVRKGPMLGCRVMQSVHLQSHLLLQSSRRTVSSRLSPISTQINSEQPCSRKGDADAHFWKEHKSGDFKVKEILLGKRLNLWVFTLGINSGVGYQTASSEPAMFVTQNKSWKGYCCPQLFNKISNATCQHLPILLQLAEKNSL